MKRPPPLLPWDLWLLRALWPIAEADDLEILLQARRRGRPCLGELPRRLLAGDRELTAQGHELLAGDSDLRAGIVLTLQVGPYPCVLEPFLAAGLAVTVLGSEACLARLRPAAASLEQRSGQGASLVWLQASAPAAGRRLRQAAQAARAGGPVVVFADDVAPDTRLRYGGEPLAPWRLPGREVRVSTALARWFCREALAVHPVAVHWCDDGRGLRWSRQATQRWTPRDDPRIVTQRIHDWIFHEIAADLAQWSGWPLLVQATLAMADGADLAGHDVVPSGLRADYQRALRLCLERAAANVKVRLEADLVVWPDDVLADLTHDRFYPAAGLRDQDLVDLRTDSCTLAGLVSRYGRRWVETHVQRLCLLGLARLQSEAK